MSNLRPQVRTAIRNFIQSQDEHHIASDVLRVIEEEANLMKETQDVHDLLDSDPMEQLEDVRRQVERLKNRMQVTSCTRVRTGSDYSGINAVVTLEKCQNLQLTFKYERKPRSGGVQGCHVCYSIELSRDHGERENLLTVQVWAPAGVPSGKPAVCVRDAFLAANEEDDEDGWDDIDEECVDDADQDQPHMIISDDSQSPIASPKKHKKQKTGNIPLEVEKLGRDNNNGDDDEEEETSDETSDDSFMAFLDPDVLETFLNSSGLMPMNEATAFFLLMTFPFYEQEWDLVGYVLDHVFGGDSDDEEGDEDAGGN